MSLNNVIRVLANSDTSPDFQYCTQTHQNLKQLVPDGLWLDTGGLISLALLPSASSELLTMIYHAFISGTKQKPYINIHINNIPSVEMYSNF